MWLDGNKLLGKVNFQTARRKLKNKTKFYLLRTTRKARCEISEI